MKTKLIIALAFIGTFANAQIQNFNTPVRFKSVNESNVAQKVAAIAEDGTLQWINRDSIKGKDLDTSRLLVKDSTNTVTSDFAISNELGQSINFNGGYSVDFTNPHGTVKIGSDEFFAIQHDSEFGSSALRTDGVYGYNSSTNSLWSLSAGHNSSSSLRFPTNIPGIKVIPVSVNGEYADDNGNITLDIPEVDLSNVLKKDEENLVANGFALKNGNSTLNIDEYLNYSNDYGNVTIGTDDRFAIMYYMNDGEYFEATTSSIAGRRNDYSWGLGTHGTSYTTLPNTGQTSRTLAVSVDGNFADENGNVDISNVLNKDEENVVTSDFSISNEDGQSINFNDYYSVDITNLNGTLQLGSDDGFALQYNNNILGSYVNLYTGGVMGANPLTNNNWSILVNSNTDSELIFPNTGRARVITTSVNNQFADENGNIEINELPTPPATGCFNLQSNNGVTSWIPCTK